MPISTKIEAFLNEAAAIILVTITNVRGSSPREIGAQLVVGPDQRFTGTIGGGSLEWQALAEAQRRLSSRQPAGEVTYALGPDLGQCCGGRVTLRFERVTTADMLRLPALLKPQPLHPVFLFGAGHVGRAVVLALAPLPFAVTWVDTRRQEFPPAFPAHVTPVAPAEAPSHVLQAPAGAFLLVMTHSHALDLAIVDLALRREDLGFVGLIGSSTKRARFVSQLRKAGLEDAALSRLVCPIGVGGLRSKEPAAIAAGVAVQLLQQLEKAGDAPLQTFRSDNSAWSQSA